MSNVGKKCKVHYTGTFNSGEKFDSSYDRGEPLEFVCGAGMMIKGFDAAVADLELGAEVDIHLLPAEAYGEADPAAIFTMPIAKLPGSEKLEVGQRVYLTNHADKLQRLATVIGGIELRTIVKGSLIMHAQGFADVAAL